MNDVTFDRIINQIKRDKIPIRFIRWGEPTLHPHLVEFIAQAKAVGCIVHLNTNGSLLDNNKIEQLIGAGLDSLKFSFQGVDKNTYYAMRNRDNYNELIETIRLFHQIRGDKNLPYLHISTTITDETPSQVRAFRLEVKEYVDLVTIGRTVLEHIDSNSLNLNDRERNTLASLKKKESVVKKHPDCPEVFDKLSINFDGTISACCWDYDNFMMIGDLMKEDIGDIWKNEKINFFRERLAAGRHDDFILCKSCYDYIALDTPGLQNIEE
jgi:MoaA/NifB/PqqE/SkfB family radical SAM enzyme